MYKTSFTFLLFFMMFALNAQKPKFANKQRVYDKNDIEILKENIISFLKDIPGWKDIEHLQEKIEFSDCDIQVYGYYDYPILQVDFRLTIPAKRRPGLYYRAQYIYYDQPSVGKRSVAIDPGTTTYIKKP